MCQLADRRDGFVEWSDDPQAIPLAERFGVGPFRFTDVQELPPHIAGLEGEHFLVLVEIPRRRQNTRLPLRLFRVIPGAH